MKEYSIIRMESSDFNNGNYVKLLRCLKEEELNVVKTTSYVEQNSPVHFDLVDISSKYLVMLVKGDYANLKSQLLVREFNCLKKDDETKLYASSEEAFDLDVLKYFNGTLEQVLARKSYVPSEQEKTIEQTLAIIKPDGMKYKNEIIKMITDSGLLIKEFKITKLSKEILEEHYAHLIDKPFYPDLERYMSSSVVIVLLIEGQNAIKRFRDLMGPTDSTKAAPNTIRGLFGTDSKLNAVHGSDSREAAEEEIKRFFKQNQKIKK